MKKIIIISLIILIIIIGLILIYPIKNNENYEESLIDLISEMGYIDINKVTYTNKHYIIDTKDLFYVLDDNLEDIASINKIDLNIQDKDLYYDDELVYEEKETFRNAIVYKYYDIYTGELAKTRKIVR